MSERSLRARLYERPPRSPALVATGASASALLALGWILRGDYYVTAERGLGYALGVCGLAMLLLLLLYPVRKRARLLRHAGPLRLWFHAHMALGLLGPTAILLHSNFRLGSINSSAALVSMLIVAASGIVGRFLYTRVHFELFGHRATLADLRDQVASGKGHLSQAVGGSPDLARALSAFESFALSPQAGLFGETGRALRMGERFRSARRIARRIPGGGEAGVNEYLEACRRVGEFSFYERAFSLWHALHLPLCFLLFAAAAVHVVAVHMY